MGKTPEELSASQRARYLANREVVLGQRKDYYAANKEHISKQQKVYYEQNRERLRAQQAAYKASDTFDRSKYRASEWAGHVRRQYGLTVEQYDQMIADQDGHCAICPETQNLHMDHDHATGRNRGFLCRNHNIALGFVQDDVNQLMALAAYLMQGENLLTPKE